MKLVRDGVWWLMAGVMLLSWVWVLGGSFSGAQPREIEVCKKYTGDCPYTSIAAAIRDAPDGATIVIWPESYNETPMEITKALTFKVKKRGNSPYIVIIHPKIGGRYGGLFRIAVDNKNKWVKFAGDAQSGFNVNGGSDVKNAVFYIQSNAHLEGVAAYGRGTTEAVIYAQLWEGMKLEFIKGQIGGGKTWGLVNESNPNSDVVAGNSLINVNKVGIGNLVGRGYYAGNNFISNGTGVYAGSSSELGRAWIENNYFESNGWGIFAETIYNIVQCKNNTFKNNEADMNDVAAEVCS